MPRKRKLAKEGPTVFGHDLEQMERAIAVQQLKLSPAIGGLERTISAWVEERLTQLAVEALSGFLLDADEGDSLSAWVLNYQLLNIEQTVLTGVVYGMLTLTEAEAVAAVMRERAYLRAGQIGPLMREVHDWLPSETALAEAEQWLRQRRATAAGASEEQPPE